MVLAGWLPSASARVCRGKHFASDLPYYYRMSALADLVTPPGHSVNWDSIFSEINGWRGACLHNFTVIEGAVTQTLLVLQAAAPPDAPVKLRQLGGQRLEDLTRALGEGGPFAALGGKAVTLLTAFRAEHEPLRHRLCHGLVKPAVEYCGSWLVVIEETSIRAQVSHTTTSVITMAEAKAALETLKRDGQRLCAVLGQIRRAATTLV